MDSKFKLILPNNNGGTQEIEATTSLLFVGANGSGKTCLGTWIEMQSPQKEKVHRLSAQKSLTMPDTTTPMKHPFIRALLDTNKGRFIILLVSLLLGLIMAMCGYTLGIGLGH